MKFLNFKRNTNSKTKKGKYIIDPYIEIGNLIKDARISKNLSIDDLSNLSKIPTSTILAIEKNNKKLLPKYPFNRSILLKLEDCLSLSNHQLIKLANGDSKPIKKRSQTKILISKLNLLNPWQGNLIYFFILLVSLFILNNFYLNSRIIEFKYIEKNNQNK
tara:strand:+ start:113 stop:595 length:483 start_codon:yes stop_codon:yes gene_type:complete